MVTNNNEMKQDGTRHGGPFYHKDEPSLVKTKGGSKRDCVSFLMLGVWEGFLGGNVLGIAAVTQHYEKPDCIIYILLFNINFCSR